MGQTETSHLKWRTLEPHICTLLFKKIPKIVLGMYIRIDTVPLLGTHCVTARMVFAYATLCTRPEYCAPGVANLACSLRASPHALIVLTAEHAAAQLHTLALAWAPCCRHTAVIRPVQIPHAPVGRGSSRARAFGQSFAKLYVWSLVEYTRVIFLDADVLILQPGAFDALFGLPLGKAPLAAARDEGACLRVARGGTCCNESSPLAARACDHNFNSGVLLLRPSSVVHADMLDAWATGRINSSDGGDQGFLQSYLARRRVVRLPRTFNTLKRAERVGTRGGGPDLMDAAALHLVGEDKPWGYRGTLCQQLYPATMDLWRQRVANCSALGCATSAARASLTASAARWSTNVRSRGEAERTGPAPAIAAGALWKRQVLALATKGCAHDSTLWYKRGSSGKRTRRPRVLRLR
jgi:hypothetical protein